MTLDEFERLLAEATPGEWVAIAGEDENFEDRSDCWILMPVQVYVYGPGGQDEKDAKAIIASRNEAPRLLALARAGERLAQYGPMAVGPHSLNPNALAVLNWESALAAWKEAWDGT